MHIEFDAEFYVALGFVIFVAILASAGVQKTIMNALDGHISKIEGELAHAQNLRQEAEQVLASYRLRAHEAEQEAHAIVEQAKSDAQTIAKEAEQRLNDYIARRTKQAEDKIHQAEVQAAADVRAAAAQAAVKAAEIILTHQVTSSPVGAKLVDAGIKDLSRLN
jgi:F-type H+-transporting ATPase subunit b